MNILLPKYNDFVKLNEGFSGKDMPKVLNAMVKYLTGKIGKIYLLPGQEEIQKDTGEILFGTHFISDDGYGIRFNWEKSDFGSESIHSIDFFNTSDLFSPNITLEMNGESIARILPAVVEIYKKQTDKVDLNDFIGESLISEAIKKPTLVRGKKAPVAGKKEPTPAKVIKAPKEKKLTKSEEAAEAKLDAIDYADPETIFEDIDSFVQMVVDGIQPSLVITGLPGVGKTYGVTKLMKDNGLKQIEPMDLPDGASVEELAELGFDPEGETDGDWVHIKGASTAFGLYINLYKYKSKLIIFDDCDKVFGDKDAVNILKGALDSSDKRVISWISKATTGKKLVAPPRFEFKGSVIFISNYYMKQIDSAIRSRSFVVDITLRASDIILRIKSIMKFIMPDVLSMEAKSKALIFLEEAVKTNAHMEISIRSLINNARIAQSGSKNWKRLMQIQAKNSI